MRHADGLLVGLNADKSLHSGYWSTEAPIPNDSLDGRHQKCIVLADGKGNEDDLLIIAVYIEDHFELPAGSILRIVVEVEGAEGIADSIRSYLCKPSAKLHQLLIRTLGGVRIKFCDEAEDRRTHTEKGSSPQDGRQNLRVTLTRGTLDPFERSQKHSQPVKTDFPPDLTVCSFIPLEGQAGQSYSFEYCVESHWPQDKESDDMQQHQEWIDHDKWAFDYFGRETYLLRRAAEEAVWAKVQSRPPAISKRVVIEGASAMPTTDIVVIFSGAGRDPPGAGVVDQPPEMCACPVKHSKASAAGTTRQSGSKGRTPAAKRLPKLPAPDATKKVKDATEVASSTCGDCNKVKAPPRGKKLGLRVVGNKKVTRYVPLDADDGYGRVAVALGDDAATAEEDESVVNDDTETMEHVQEDSRTASSADQGIAPAAVEQPSTGVEDTTEEPIPNTQDPPEDPPETPEENASAVSVAGSSPPDSRKRPGDALPEEPAAKKASGTSESATKDKDDEVVATPVPAVKLESDEIITIEDDSDNEVQYLSEAKKQPNSRSVEEIRLQHQLQLVEMDKRAVQVEKRELQLARKELALKHRLDALQRSDTIKEESQVKIEE